MTLPSARTGDGSWVVYAKRQRGRTAFVSIGYVLFEEGVLTEGEARWLDEAVELDPDTDPRRHRP
jgi:hypothetical protein